MPYAGTFDPPVSPGDIRYFRLDFADGLQAYDAVKTIISTSVTVSPKSKAADPNATSLINGVPVIMGNEVVQQCGLAAPSGFVAGALYIMSATVLTNQGEVLVGWGHIECKGFV